MADANVLAPPPIQTAVIGPDGLMTTPWALYFQKLNLRVGGPYSDTVTQISGSVSGIQGQIGSLSTEVGSLQAQEAAQTVLISALESSVGSPKPANTAFMGPATGSAVPTFRAIQAADLPGRTVTVVTAALTVGGTQGSMTFSNGILTAEVQAT